MSKLMKGQNEQKDSDNGRPVRSLSQRVIGFKKYCSYSATSPSHGGCSQRNQEQSYLQAILFFSESICFQGAYARLWYTFCTSSSSSSASIHFSTSSCCASLKVLLLLWGYIVTKSSWHSGSCFQTSTCYRSRWTWCRSQFLPHRDECLPHHHQSNPTVHRDSMPGSEFKTPSTLEHKRYRAWVAHGAIMLRKV